MENSTEPDSLPKIFWTWWNDLEKFGFILPLERNENEEDGRGGSSSQCKDDNNRRETWNTNVFQVRDPIVYIDPRESGNQADSPDLCRTHISLGKEYLLNGRWRKGLREGAGGISGPGLEEFGIRDITGTYKRGKLQGKGKVFLTSGIVLQGTFEDSKLEGLVRGFAEQQGNMCLVGRFKDGRPSGPFWKMLTGRAFIYGNLDRGGRFTGLRIFYLFPDISTSICGFFKDEQLAKGHQCSLQSLELRDQLLVPEFTEAKGHEIRYAPSSLTTVNCDPLQEDIFEAKWVYVRKSRVSDNAGEGLYAKQRIPAGATVAFYNGIRVRPGETPPFRSFDYEIYVDWNKTSVSMHTDEFYKKTKRN